MRNRCVISSITSMLTSLARARSAARPANNEGEKENEETETDDDDDDVMRAEIGGDIQNVVALALFGSALVDSGLSPDRRGRPPSLARSICQTHTSSKWLSWPLKTAACFNNDDDDDDDDVDEEEEEGEEG